MGHSKAKLRELINEATQLGFHDEAVRLTKRLHRVQHPPKRHKKEASK